MPDIRVEKTFKDISSIELFQRFCQALRNSKLPENYREGAPWTELLRRILREIGTSLGYRVSDLDFGIEWLTIDQTWRIHESTLVRTYLAMEEENTYDVEDVIDDEVEKLLDIKSNVKLLIYYPDKSVQSLHLSMLQEAIDIGPLLPDERFVVIMIDSDATSEDDYGKYTKLTVQGYELAKKMQFKEVGAEEIPRKVSA